MKKIIVLVWLLTSIHILSINILAQDTNDTTKSKAWAPSGIAGFNISQIAFSNWSQGGDDAITYSITGNFGLNYTSTTSAFKNSLKLAYGQTKLADADFKTNDNEIYLENVYSRRMGWSVDPFISNILRTGIAPAYDYSKEPRKKISSFFDPGYLSQSLGFTYDRDKVFKTRLGVALQETFTNEFNQYSDDPKTTEVENFKLETGIESVSEAQWEFMENMLLKSYLRLFSAFDRLDTWDVRWDNTVSAKINKWFVFNINVLVVYEKRQTTKTQIKEAMMLGISYRIF